MNQLKLSFIKPNYRNKRVKIFNILACNDSDRRKCNQIIY